MCMLGVRAGLKSYASTVLQRVAAMKAELESMGSSLPAVTAPTPAPAPVPASAPAAANEGPVVPPAMQTVLARIGFNARMFSTLIKPDLKAEEPDYLNLCYYVCAAVIEDEINRLEPQLARNPADNETRMRLQALKLRKMVCNA